MPMDRRFTPEELAALRVQADEHGYIVSPDVHVMLDVLEDQRDEIARLKEVIAAKSPEDGKSVRVEMNTTPEGKPCLIVTAPVHFDEQRLAETIAGAMNLWTATAEHMAR